MGPDTLLSDSRLRFGGITYELHERLGNGRFATVYAMRRADGAAGYPLPADPPLAAKVSLLPGMSAWARAQLAEEVSIWPEVSSVRHGIHPNIVRFVGRISSADQHVAILERAVGGELFDRIIKLSHFDEATAARQVGQVLSAVDHLHLHGIVHRDLKPENLLLASDADDAAVKVADFGAAKRLLGPEGAPARTPCGSLGYAAPEQVRRAPQRRLRAGAYPGAPRALCPSLRASPPAPEQLGGDDYDARVDVWAVGVITYVLLTGMLEGPPRPPAMLRHRRALSLPALAAGYRDDALRSKDVRHDAADGALPRGQLPGRV